MPANRISTNNWHGWILPMLANAKDWIIVAGHHPIYAYTPKEESERMDMQKRIDPLLHANIK